jgi:hypothetical protein
VGLINIWAFSCLYMGLFVPALNGPCSCPPMGRDLGPNPARYNGPCRPGTKLFRVVSCLGRAFFSVLRAGPSGPAQMYTYSYDQGALTRTNGAVFHQEAPHKLWRSFYRRWTSISEPTMTSDKEGKKPIDTLR